MTTDLSATLAAEVSGEQMMRHLSEFARWQKLAGTEEEALSLAYVRQELDSYGLKTTLLEHDAFISLPGASWVKIGERRLTSITHSMGLPGGEAGLTRRLVDLGDGSKAAFAAADVQGAIVLIDGMATPEMALRAGDAGAAGQIHISPHEHLHEMCLSPVWGNPDRETAPRLPRTVAATVSKEDGGAIRDWLKSAPDLPVTIYADVDTGWRKIPILVADLRADNAPADAPFILFTGHHDTWYEGVMDNGSANATMMEVARLLAPRKGEMKRHLRLCFWSGHSQGRYAGSAWYADTHWHELERDCAVHVNVDSTGGVGNTNLSRAPSATELREVARDAVALYSGQTLEGRRMSRNADQSFWGIGVPSLFSILSEQPATTAGVRNALGWWWHTPQDRIDRIDPALLTRDTRIYLYTITRLVSDQTLPLDLVAQVKDLQETLSVLDLPDSHSVPLDALLHEAEALSDTLRSIQGTVLSDPVAGMRRDRLLMRVSRRLVPFEYTSGDRHAHDPALPISKWMSLEPLHRFAATAGGTEEFHLCHGPAIRAANRLLAAICDARADIASANTNGGPG